MTSTVTRLVWFAALVGGFAQAVNAHAVLQQATPSAGSTVHEPPAQIRLRFTERIESAFSAVQVLDAAGKRVDMAVRQYDPVDSKLLSSTALDTTSMSAASVKSTSTGPPTETSRVRPIILP